MKLKKYYLTFLLVSSIQIPSYAMEGQGSDQDLESKTSTVSSKLYMAVREAPTGEEPKGTGRIALTSSSNGTNWSDLPYPDQNPYPDQTTSTPWYTTVSPSLASHKPPSTTNSTLYMAWVDDTGRPTMSKSFDGIHWYEPYNPDTTTTSRTQWYTKLPVNLFSYNKNLYMGVVDERGAYCYSTSSDGLVGWAELLPSATPPLITSNSVSEVAYGDGAYAGVVDMNENIIVSRSGSVKPVNQDWKTEWPISLATHPINPPNTPNRLYMAMVEPRYGRGLFGRISMSYLNVATPGGPENWFPNQPGSGVQIPAETYYPGKDQPQQLLWNTDQPVSLASYSNKLYMATVLGYYIVISSSADGQTNWTIPQPANRGLNLKTSSSVSLATF